MTGEADERHAYCRQVETYLQKKNDGHLVRIVGPAFEKVLGWAEKGVPLAVVYRGVDRYFERYYAKGPQRRPVRIEFCEHDVLDVFDEWRRAVGVPIVPGVPGVRKDTLPAHLERVVARLTALRASSSVVSGFSRTTLDATVDEIVRELDAARAAAKGIRGDARAAFLDRLRALDAELVTAARQACDAATLDALGAEADAELAPFRARMPPESYARSRRACVDRLLREREKLPVIAFE
ncbi:MAG: hypothetical protein FJW14_14395 [Acidimicrobiia bacterium]|nr:hypothetical protein [Acidimicrobiia bacterium]